MQAYGTARIPVNLDAYFTVNTAINVYKAVALPTAEGFVAEAARVKAALDDPNEAQQVVVYLHEQRARRYPGPNGYQEYTRAVAGCMSSAGTSNPAQVSSKALHATGQAAGDPYKLLGFH